MIMWQVTCQLARHLGATGIYYPVSSIICADNMLQAHYRFREIYDTYFYAKRITIKKIL